MNIITDINCSSGQYQNRDKGLKVQRAVLIHLDQGLDSLEYIQDNHHHKACYDLNNYPYNLYSINNTLCIQVKHHHNSHNLQHTLDNHPHNSDNLHHTLENHHHNSNNRHHTLDNHHHNLERHHHTLDHHHHNLDRYHHTLDHHHHNLGRYHIIDPQDNHPHSTDYTVANHLLSQDSQQ